MRVGIQLYTLRNSGATVSERIESVSHTAFEGVQFAGLSDESPDDVGTTLDRTGFEVAGAHVGIDEIEGEYGSTVATYDALGCDDLVVPSYDAKAFETGDGAREAGRRLSALADRLGDDGIDLHYHNHSFEFTALDGGTAFDAFADAAEGVGLEIDTGLANRVGIDPAALIERYDDRVSLVHLTDSRTDPDGPGHMNLGDGDVDLQRCVDAADAASVDWLLFEHGIPDDPLGSAEHAAEVMSRLVSES